MLYSIFMSITTGDVGPDRECYKYINVTYCMDDLEDFLHVDGPNEQCR